MLKVAYGVVLGLALVVSSNQAFALLKDASFPVLEASQFHSIKTLPQMDNTVAVTVIINQKQSSTFLVDTGATYTVITPALAKELGVSVKESQNLIPLNTANGMTHVPIVSIRHLTVGPLHVENVEALVSDLGSNSDVSGLLGMNFFLGKTLLITPNRLFIGIK